MTIHVYAETNLLSLPQGWWCVYQTKRCEGCFYVWFIIAVSVQFTEFFFSSLCSLDLYYLIPCSLGRIKSHALYLLAGYLYEACIALIKLFVPDLSVLISSVILSLLPCSFSFSRMNVFLSANTLQFYHRNLFMQCGFWWNRRKATWDLCYKNRTGSKFCCYIRIILLICVQLRVVYYYSLFCCKCNRFTVSKRSMASEVIGHFMFFTSKARFQTAYGLRPSVIYNCFVSLPIKKPLAILLPQQGQTNCEVLSRQPMPQPSSCV